MKEVAISVFKAKCLGILEEVRKTRKRFASPPSASPLLKSFHLRWRSAPETLARLHGGHGGDSGGYRRPHGQPRGLGSGSRL